MARRSPIVDQTYKTGCTWPLFRIFNFCESDSDRRFVSNRRLPNVTDAGNGNWRSSISYVENDKVAECGRNEVTKMVMDETFVNKIYQAKTGASCEANQLLDALQILYSNKELLLKILQDPNSLLVKQIHDSPSFEVKESYLAWLKRMTRLNKSQNSNTRQCVKSSKSFDRYDSSTSCKPQFSNRILVLKRGRVNAKNFADTTSLYSRPSGFPLCHIKKRLRHVTRVRRKEVQMKTVDKLLSKFRGGSLGLEDGKKVNSRINVHTSIVKRLSSFLDLKKRDKVIKFKDSELLKRQEVASFGERFTKNTNKMLNIHVEGRKGPENIPYSPRDEGANASPTQNIDERSFLDSHPEIQILSHSPDIASSSPSSCHKLDDDVNIRTRVDDHLSNAESLHEQFIKDDATNPPITISQSDQLSSVQAICDKFEEDHLAELTKSSWDQTNNSKSSKDHVREILQLFSLKWDELANKSETHDPLLDPSTFDELKEGLSSKIYDGSNFLDCVIETFVEVYHHHYSLSFHISSRNPNVQAHVAKKVLVKEITELVNLQFHPRPSPTTLEQLVEKDLARNGLWLNKNLVTEDIAIELEEFVLENLVLEIVSEMDIIHHTLI